MAGRRAMERRHLTPESFAWLLRDLRERAGYDTVASLAVELSVTASHVVKIEALERVPSRDLAREIDQVLRTHGQLVRAWDDVAWHAEVEHPDWFRRFAEIEAQADAIRDYQVSRVSGLLQTPDYARALFAQHAAGDEDLIRERVAARMSRQRRFLEPDGPLLIVVLDEAVIRRIVGGRQVMYGQLRHLIEAGKLPNVVVQVSPFELGERSTAGTSHVLASLPDGPEWLYSESLGRGHLVNDPERLRERSRAYDRLRADALSAPDSARLIRSAMEGLVNVKTSGNLTWRKSTYSDGDGGNCVEISEDLLSTGIVPVRDSKNPEGPQLHFSKEAWAAFAKAAASGAFGTV
ncbi:helix-turn-helix domain-containing protein [Kitasatospora sp. McL0602]|uniref:helix-turn-helix domain-containing protein n=1 Tax=Kitasatospora sp. McL0602 TaxID=3439530 RepID=UPI003F8CBBA6